MRSIKHVFVLFLHYDAKHILWVLNRSMIVRPFERVPTIYVFLQKQEKTYILLAEKKHRYLEVWLSSIKTITIKKITYMLP